MAEARVEVPGSAPVHGIASGSFSALPSDERIVVTIVLRRPSDMPDVSEQLLSGKFRPISRDAAERFASADPGDIEAVERFALSFDLSILEADAASRTVKVTGSLAAFGSAFEIRFGLVEDTRTYDGPVTVPANLGGVILAVLGLDNHPIARSRAANPD